MTNVGAGAAPQPSGLHVCLVGYFLLIVVTTTVQTRYNNWLPISSPQGSLFQDNNTEPARDIHVDAFNPAKCGTGRFRVWQKAENAYGCPPPEGRRNSVRELTRGPLGWWYRLVLERAPPRIADGLPASEGEFPSFVRLKLYYAEPGRVSSCGGTLIHDNLVLTVAHCLTDVVRITATLGTNLLNGTGGVERETDKWCYHVEWRPPGKPVHKDLAMVRLSEPVQYEPYRIVPACLQTHYRHQDLAGCSVAGMGLINNFNTVADRLLTLLVRRRCTNMFVDYRYASCFVADKTGLPCPGDSGSPVYCYDTCGATSTRAFVVGAVAGGLKDACIPGKLFAFQVSDFNWMHNSIMHQIQGMRSQGQVMGATCVIPPVLRPKKARSPEEDDDKPEIEP